MTPDLDTKLREYLDDRDAEKRSGITLAGLHGAVVKLTDALHEHIESDRKAFAHQDDRWKRLHEWKRGIALALGRTPMRSSPSNPDDSGSIELKGLGIGLKAAGAWPVRVVLGLVISAAIFLGGFALHSVLGK